MFFQEREVAHGKIKIDLRAEAFFPWSQAKITVVVYCLCVACSGMFACWLWWFLRLWWLVFLLGFVCFVLFSPFGVGAMGPSYFALLGGGSFLVVVVCCFLSSLALLSSTSSFISCFFFLWCLLVLPCLLVLC